MREDLITRALQLMLKRKDEADVQLHAGETKEKRAYETGRKWAYDDAIELLCYAMNGQEDKLYVDFP